MDREGFINQCIEAYMDRTGIDFYHKDLVEMVDYLNSLAIEDDLSFGYKILESDECDWYEIGSFANANEFMDYYFEISDPLYNYMLKW